MPRTAVPAIALALIANFIPLYNVLAQHWPVVYVVMLFWFDVLLIVAFTAVKILIAPLTGYISPAVVLIVGYAGATLVFYGGLVLIYGFFLALLFGGEITPRGLVSNPDVALGVMTRMLGEPAVFWTALAILGIHLHSLIVYVAAREAWSTAQPERLFDMPLRHLVVLHVGIVLGGGVLTLLAPPVIAATVLLAGKTVSDLRVVARERS